MSIHLYHLTPDAHPEAELFIMLSSFPQSLKKELGSTINMFPFIKEEIIIMYFCNDQ